jgi:hypothetical protein
LAIQPAGKNHTPAEGIAALIVDQADSEKLIERTAEWREMATKVSARRIPDAQFFDATGITQSTLLQILCRFRVALQLQLVETMCVFQQLGIAIGT